MNDFAPTSSGADSRIAAFRRFNRFYTQKIGVLDRCYLQSEFSVGEGRVLYELAQRDETTASEISASLGLDMGYLSRILAKLERQQLIRRASAEQDARQRLIQVTPKGRKAMSTLESRSEKQAGSLLAELTDPQQTSILQAMSQIRAALGDSKGTNEPYIIRTHRTGDLSWIAHRHAILYNKEYGLNQAFEALVLDITAHFLKHYDPEAERCWVAERSGEILGCVLLVKSSKQIAKLRLLLVEPSARGLGIGKRLVEECIRFAREKDYKKIVLWTQSNLTAARGIYQKAGFELVATDSHEDFGPRLTAETWELRLTPQA
ncbi:MAG: MarR family transcriptional regulator [Verrucomicrobia bacterium]|nr:MarR family transcriptional regulator [Verrucomicrobiota bacterium]